MNNTKIEDWIIKHSNTDKRILKGVRYCMNIGNLTYMSEITKDIFIKEKGVGESTWNEFLLYKKYGLTEIND